MWRLSGFSSPFSTRRTMSVSVALAHGRTMGAAARFLSFDATVIALQQYRRRAQSVPKHPTEVRQIVSIWPFDWTFMSYPLDKFVH